MRRSVVLLLSLFLLLVLTSGSELRQWVPDEFHISIYHPDADQGPENDNCEIDFGEDIQNHSAELTINGSRDFSIMRADYGFAVVLLRPGELVTPPPEYA